MKLNDTDNDNDNKNVYTTNDILQHLSHTDTYTLLKLPKKHSLIHTTSIALPKKLSFSHSLYTLAMGSRGGEEGSKWLQIDSVTGLLTSGDEVVQWSAEEQIQLEREMLKYVICCIYILIIIILLCVIIGPG
jgi:hypothetical protein